MNVRITPTTLADGRELIYFDDSEPYVSGGATRTLVDSRPLPDRFAPVTGADGTPQPVTGPELRRDPLTGEWIPMAAHRMNRTFLPPADANPLAPAKPGAAYQDGEIPAEDYDVVVFENRFPSLLAVPGVPDAPVQRDGEPLWTVRPAAGRCEVICFSSDSTASLSTVSADAHAHDRRGLGAAHRGPERAARHRAGLRVREPRQGDRRHAAPPARADLRASRTSPRARPRCSRRPARTARAPAALLGRDVLDAELAHGERIVLESEHWVAYVPFAARWPVEVHLAPRRDVPDLPGPDRRRARRPVRPCT